MAALTEEQLKAKIASELGQPDSLELAAQIDLGWEQFAMYAYTAPNLRYFYTERDAIRWLLGGNWKKFNWMDQGVVQSDSQVFDHLHTLMMDVQTEIERLERIARGNRAGIVTQLANEAVYTNPFGYPNPNSRIYRGDPLVRRIIFRR